jgi:hypothetical protein
MRVQWFLWMNVLIICAVPVRPAAHELHHEVSHGDTVVITFTYTGNIAFSHEAYELYRPGETSPAQSGRTDAGGRIRFVPDREGPWRVRTFSPDGHGSDITIDIGANGSLGRKKPLSGRLVPRIAAGVAAIFFIFGVLFFFSRSKKT